MPTTTMVHVRIDDRIKEQAAAALAEMGLSLSDAVRVFLTRVAHDKALPFVVKVPSTGSLKVTLSFSTAAALKYGIAPSGWQGSWLAAAASFDQERCTR